MFEAFPKLTRFSHDWTVTEKIDGSNGQILIVSELNPLALPLASMEPLAKINGNYIYAGSRNRMLSLGKSNDHFGFAQFVADNAEELIAKLGEGRHFGEWYGKGIGPRGYDLDQKRFALFNAGRWEGADLPERIDVVPVLFKGYLEDSGTFDKLLTNLKEEGSKIAPGYLDPEGIVMYHGPSKTLFKKTFDYDEAGKWAENQARKGLKTGTV